MSVFPALWVYVKYGSGMLNVYIYICVNSVLEDICNESRDIYHITYNPTTYEFINNMNLRSLPTWMEP